MSFLEIAVYKNPQGEPKEAGERLREVEGLLSVHYGVQIEDSAHIHWVLPFAASPEYGEYRKYAGELFGESILVEVTSQSDIQTVFGAPVSEFAIATLKSPLLRDQWNKCLEVTLGGMKMTKGAIAGVRGISEGNPDQYVFVIGWESIEVCA
ncbi:hypothetical protein PM082_005475 [Marasmius tenuissimus]|nr:hypothetical protein PM082_005475 [Marasmius tenuissimus]